MKYDYTMYVKGEYMANVRNEQVVKKTFEHVLEEKSVFLGKELTNTGYLVDLAIHDILATHTFVSKGGLNNLDFEELHEALEQYIKTIAVVEFGVLANVEELVGGIWVITNTNFQVVE